MRSSTIHQFSGSVFQVECPISRCGSQRFNRFAKPVKEGLNVFLLIFRRWRWRRKSQWIVWWSSYSKVSFWQKLQNALLRKNFNVSKIVESKLKLIFKNSILRCGVKCTYRVTKTIFFWKKCLYLLQFWSYTKILEYGKVWQLYILFKQIKIFSEKWQTLMKE